MKNYVFMRVNFNLLYEFKPDDKPQRRTFAEKLLQKMEEDETFLQRAMFSDEATLRVSCIVDQHDTRTCGLENPYTVLELARDSPKVNVWCSLLHDRIIGPFSFPK
ncbi:hypothetical protein AVEN_111719-1 [Araneus ventricosus]|uniref:Uncharacterized protein n=1 Tax=Araneus ventricosus TaxID=182803 RepID=A0A4Y2C9E9_ARAVE|nr:hypothetical protein AVEN_111719-1 [Araneus ventricosus]